MPHLFSPLPLRSVTLRNRLMISPMCMYSAKDGLANDWHLAHLGARAAGGAGLVCAEATAIEPRGRISPADLGLWSDAQIEPLARVARFVASQGAVPAIQLAHAGRKASTSPPWEGGGPLAPTLGGWEPVAPSALPFAPGHAMPRALATHELPVMVDAFVQATRRALAAGFQAVEIHAAHGYLLHQFLSPLSNERTDDFGGRFENRVRLTLQVVEAVRAEWPERLPLLLRISTTDWAKGGWDVEQSVELARLVSKRGVDLVDCSSGGLVPHAKIPVGPGFQVPAGERVRREAGVPVVAVGLITEARQADALVREEKADVVAIARQSLRDPSFPLHAAKELGVDVAWPVQYQRAKP
ncbi:MAG: NADH:flavin oxidoreductase/NADH oxidase [Myxococcales bacterium]